MDNEDKINDYQEQYDILVEEEKEKQNRKTFWLIFICLFAILISVLGATYSYYRVFTIEKPQMNLDTNGDGKPDLNVDLDNDGICDVNCDIDNDGKPDTNLDYRGDLKPHFNLDLDGDGKPDDNLLNQDTNNDGICDINCDTDGDGHPDTNHDIDGNGTPDINIDTDNDGEPDLNVDTSNDGIPDTNIDTDGDGKPDKNVDNDGDGICDENCVENTPKPEEPIVEVNENAVLYVNYIKGVDIDKMAPGTSATQTFTVENQSNYPLYFNVDWIDVKNELTVREGLTYQVIRDQVAVTEEIPTPNTDGRFLENVYIAPHTTYTYEIIYTFHNLSDIDQTLDQNKVFSTKIKAEVIQP